MTRIIGLMSGTSADGIDAALVEVTESQESGLQVTLLGGMTTPYPAPLRSRILDVCAGAPLSMEALADLDEAIAVEFAQAALTLQAQYGPAELIGSHGQTVYHRPPTSDQLGYSLQLGRGAAIAQRTGLPVINNFRSADLAAGGHGAPLVPRVDAYLLGHAFKHRCVQNIGGIGNVTYLPARQDPQWESQVRGWDTGPGNVLLDLAVAQLSGGQQTYDANGDWAAQGQPCEPLLTQWLQHPFFCQPPPKSTGRELFGPDYLQQCLADAAPYSLSSADILATLTELTARSIVESYRAHLPQMPDQVLIGGGGTRNLHLCDRLRVLFDPIPVLPTDELGVNADLKEAIAFAVLAYWRSRGIPGNLPSVTGARESVLLGDVHGVVAGHSSNIGF